MFKKYFLFFFVSLFLINESRSELIPKEITIRFSANDVDEICSQLNESLPKMGPGMIKMGYNWAQSLVPVRNELLKGTAGFMGIIVSALILKNIANKYVTKYLYEPALIEEYLSQNIANQIKSKFKQPLNIRDEMVISSQLEEQLNYVIKMTSNIKHYGGTYENVMLYGLPGTGKTLFAKLLARSCGMNYAFVPAANISQFFANGRIVEELNKLFEWASRSKYGTIIFFDEAETFLADRKTLSAIAQNALGAFLAKTGTASDRVMIFCATNRPEIMDAAVLSRFGMQIHFPLPDLQARHDQLLMHIEKVFANQKKGIITYDILQDENYVNSIAQKIDGWSGRTIKIFVNRLRQQALADLVFKLTPAFVDKVINQTNNSETTKEIMNNKQPAQAVAA